MPQRYDAVIIGGGHNGLDLRRLPRARGPQDPRPRAAPRPGRRRRHRGDRPGLPVLGRELRRQPAAARDHPRPRAAQVRPRHPPARRHVHAAAQGRRAAPRAATTCGASTTTGARSASSAAGRSTTPRRTRSTASSWWRWPGSSSRSWASSRPTRPTSTRGRCCRSPASPAASPQLPERQQAVFVQLMTMSAADFLDQWFETDPLKATMSASGIIGTYQGIRSPGHGVRAAPPLHGRDRRRVPRLGHPQGRHRRRLLRDRPRGPGAGRGDPDRGARRPDHRPRRPGDRRRRSRAARRSRRPTSSRPPTRRSRSSTCWSPARSTPSSSRRSAGSSSAAARARSTSPSTALPDFTCLPGVGEHLRGAISFSPSMARDGAGLRRREVRPLEPAARTST